MTWDPLALDPLSPIGPGARPVDAHPSGPDHPSERHDMKVVVIGGTGLIGSKLVSTPDLDDVARAVARVAVGAPVNGIVEAAEVARVWVGDDDALIVPCAQAAPDELTTSRS
jgi:hypothetical protein